MSANNNLMPVQGDREKDEKALAIVALAQRIWAGLLGVYALMMAVGAAGLFMPGGSLQFSFIMLAYMAIAVPAVAIYSWLNLKSAKAILERRDAQFSCFVAGMNMMVFPVGTLIGLYSWRVLARESVKRLYDEDLPRLSNEPSKQGKKGITAPAKPEVIWHDASIEIDESEEELWKEIEAKSTGTHNLKGTADGGKTKSVPADNAPSAKPPGSVKLVASDE